VKLIFKYPELRTFAQEPQVNKVLTKARNDQKRLKSYPVNRIQEKLASYPGGGGGYTPLYELGWYVWRQGIWFASRFGLK